MAACAGSKGKAFCPPIILTDPHPRSTPRWPVIRELPQLAVAASPFLDNFCLADQLAHKSTCFHKRFYESFPSAKSLNSERFSMRTDRRSVRMMPHSVHWVNRRLTVNTVVPVI